MRSVEGCWWVKRVPISRWPYRFIFKEEHMKIIPSIPLQEKKLKLYSIPLCRRDKWNYWNNSRTLLQGKNRQIIPFINGIVFFVLFYKGKDWTSFTVYIPTGKKIESSSLYYWGRKNKNCSLHSPASGKIKLISCTFLKEQKLTIILCTRL